MSLLTAAKDDIKAERDKVRADIAAHPFRTVWVCAVAGLFTAFVALAILASVVH